MYSPDGINGWFNKWGIWGENNVGVESCKSVFLGGTSYSLVETFAVGCIV